MDLSEDRTTCCSGTLSAVPSEMALSQRIPYGTTAWRISMGRRQVVESVNSALKGAFVDLARGFFRVLGQVKMTVLLGFTLAAYNLDRVRSFRAKQAQDKEMPKRRAKRDKERGTTSRRFRARSCRNTRQDRLTSQLAKQQRSGAPCRRAPTQKSQYRLTRNCRPEGRQFVNSGWRTSSELIATSNKALS